MPANCAALRNLAISKGFYQRCTYAIGYDINHVADGDEIHSVLLILLFGGWTAARLSLRWESPRGGEKMGFARGFVHRAGSWPEQIGFAAAKKLVQDA